LALDYSKGERCHQALQDWQLKALRNAIYAAGELVLDDLVDGVDVIDALDFVEIALMHRVDADPAWAAVRARLAADAIGACVGHMASLAPSTRV